MPIKNTVLKALANAIRQAKRRNDPAAVDELEAKRRTFHLNQVSCAQSTGVTHVKSKREIRLDSNWIYFMQQAESGLFKIGFSNDPQTRRTALQVGNPHKLVITFTHQTQRPDDLEDQIHADLIASLVRGEWYALTGTIDYQSIIRDAENKLNIRNEEILQKEIDVQRLNLKKGSSLRN